MQHRRWPRTLFVSTVLGASALFGGSDARAESGVAPPKCDVYVAPMGSRRVVPSNLPALVAMDRSSVGRKATVTVDGPYTVGPDPRQAGAELIAPNAPFAEGDLTLKATIACSDGSSKEETMRGPKVGPAVPLPSAIGAFGAARAPNENGSVDYPLSLTPEAAAFVATTRFDLSVDGKAVGGQGYGVGGESTAGSQLTLTLEGGAVYLGGTLLGSGRVCAGQSGREKHALELRAHVAGATTDPAPLPLEVDVDCAPPKASSQGPGLADGGVDDQGDGGGGCATAGAADVGGFGLVLSAGALASLLLERRRRPRRVRG